MPKEISELENEISPLGECPNCYANPLEPFLRGQVQRDIVFPKSRPNCALICRECKEIVGYEGNNRASVLDFATVTDTGWLLFCPIWIEFEDYETTIFGGWIPRNVPYFVFDFAIEVQQWINYVMSFIDDDACGFVVHHIRSIKPKRFAINERDLRPRSKSNKSESS